MSVTVVRAAGGPHQRGLAVGRALAEPIHRSLAFYREILERRGRSSLELPTMLGAHRSATEQTYPALVEELAGMAEGADAPWWELFAVNAFEELEPMLEAAPAMERCTAFAVAGPEGTVLAHNEQWYAGDAGNVAVVVGVPDDGPAFASPTVVACLPAVGMNAAGVAQGVMSLEADDDGVGIPRVFTSRSALQASSLRDAERLATPNGRAGGYAYVVAARDAQTATIETSATRHVVRGGAAAHTNHYLDPRLAALAPDPSAGSVSRLERLRALLAERDPRTPEGAMAILRDHEAQPQSICRHPDPGDGDEGTAILFSMVCLLEERRMWVAAGQPCEAAYEEIDLSEVA
jgi:isopenicillin-N N-acyltransferase-like protein